MKFKLKKFFNSLKNFSKPLNKKNSPDSSFASDKKVESENNSASVHKKQQLGKIQSFTFYIPAPPERKTGYREKQFDKLFFEFINLGFEIISVQTVPNAGPNQSGMWFICIVRATTPEANMLHLESFFHDNFDQNEVQVKQNEVKESIDGLYQID